MAGLLGCSAARTMNDRPPAIARTQTAAGQRAEALPFIHDDYPKALAEAKRRGKPLFVDAWAPWCHSCQSLRAFVLTDPVLIPLADDFVWLSIDTEKDVNVEWVTKHPHAALPTLWVIDPATDRSIFKWVGGATAEELRVLLAIAVSDARSAPSSSESPTMAATAAFVRGNHAVAEGDAEAAEKEYRQALASAPKDHPHRARIVEALVTQLSFGKQHGACAATAAAEAGELPAGSSRAIVLASGLSCARDAKRTADLDRLLPLALRDARARDASLLADDRSALYEEAVETKKWLAEAGGPSKATASEAQGLAREWAAFLEGEAARAKTADARASLDPLRLAAYLILGEPARAIPMLDQSEKDFPDDYNPPARLGRVYLESKRLDDADKAIDRAITRVYGPRAMRVYAAKADIAKARGDRAAEIAALETALARSEGAVLTAGQRTVRDGLVKRLSTLR